MSDIIGFSQMIFQGRLTRDPETRTLDNGNTLCKFSVAVNKRMSNGEEKTSFIPVTVFGRNAVNCGKFLTQGRVVLVSGEFETDKYVDKEGNNRTGFSCLARNVEFGSGGTREEDESEGMAPSKAKTIADVPEKEQDRLAKAYFRKNQGR